MQSGSRANLSRGGTEDGDSNAGNGGSNSLARSQSKPPASPKGTHRSSLARNGPSETPPKGTHQSSMARNEPGGEPRDNSDDEEDKGKLQRDKPQWAPIKGKPKMVAQMSRKTDTSHINSIAATLGIV